MLFCFKVEWSAKLILQGFCMWYNFIRIHQGIGCGPSEKAGKRTSLTNKWLELIKVSSAFP